MDGDYFVEILLCDLVERLANKAKGAFHVHRVSYSSQHRISVFVSDCLVRCVQRSWNVRRSTKNKTVYLCRERHVGKSVGKMMDVQLRIGVS